MRAMHVPVLSFVLLSGCGDDASRIGDPSDADELPGVIQQAAHGPIPNVLVRLVSAPSRDHVLCDGRTRGMAVAPSSSYRASVSLSYPSGSSVERSGIVSLSAPTYADATDGAFGIELYESPPASGEYTVATSFKRQTTERTAGVHRCAVRLEEDVDGGAASWLTRFSASGSAVHGVTAAGASRPVSWHRQSGTNVYCQSRLNFPNPAATYFIDVQASTDGGNGSVANVEFTPGTPFVGPLLTSSGVLFIERGTPPFGTPSVDARLDFAGQALDSPSSCSMTFTENDPSANVVLQSTTSLGALLVDMDGDGFSDFIELAIGTDPENGADNPRANGDLVFTVPHMTAPDPPVDTLPVSAAMSQVDVFFEMDTTFSMAGEISNLKNSLSTIMLTLTSQIPDVAFGVGGYDDFAIAPYGDPGDQPFYLLHRIMTVTTAAGRNSVTNRVNLLAVHSGGDLPESGWEALHQIATGAGVSVGPVSVPSFNPATAFPSAPPAGESLGTLGGVGFRALSLPIAVMVTDAQSHNNGQAALAYSFGGAATRAAAISEAQALEVRVIGVISQGGDFANAKADMTAAVSQTGAVVPPSAWSANGAARPAACPESSCCTGIGSAGEAPDANGLCPLVFTVDSSGAGLGNAIIAGVNALRAAGSFDVKATLVDDPSDGVDAVQEFVDHIAANSSGPSPCATGFTAVDTTGDGHPDTFLDATLESPLCFDVVPKMNTSVTPLALPQVFKVTLNLLGDGVTKLGSRNVYFVVSP